MRAPRAHKNMFSSGKVYQMNTTLTVLIFWWFFIKVESDKPPQFNQRPVNERVKIRSTFTLFKREPAGLGPDVRASMVNYRLNRKRKISLGRTSSARTRETPWAQ